MITATHEEIRNTLEMLRYWTAFLASPPDLYTYFQHPYRMLILPRALVRPEFERILHRAINFKAGLWVLGDVERGDATREAGPLNHRGRICRKYAPTDAGVPKAERPTLKTPEEASSFLRALRLARVEHGIGPRAEA